jgi:predicted phage gp36 major capsid-like protein
MELETKALVTRDASQEREVKEAFDGFRRMFELFKEDNDARLAQIEKRSTDVITDEKVERINKALDAQKRTLDELMLSAARPARGGETKAATIAPRASARRRSTAMSAKAMPAASIRWS